MLFKSVVLIAALATTSAAAQTADPLTASREAQIGIFVSTRGINFSDPIQVGDLHRLLARKAEQVCDSANPRRLAVVASDTACARDAVDRAVAQSQEHALMGFHDAVTAAAAPVRLTQR